MHCTEQQQSTHEFCFTRYVEALAHALVTVLDSGVSGSQGTGTNNSIDISVDFNQPDAQSNEEATRPKEQVQLNSAGEPIPTGSAFMGGFGGFGGFRASHAAVRSPADDYYFEYEDYKHVDVNLWMGML